MRKPAHLWNVKMPMTSRTLISALEVIRPEFCYCVLYGLKLIAESPSGIEALRRCKFVTSAGARTPDELGECLVKEGVRLGALFGLTEVGHVGDSLDREPGDNS